VTYDYFQRALRRPLEPLTGAVGRRVQDESGNAAQFAVELQDGRIVGVRYRCTSCTTLVAVSEHLAELAAGCTSDAMLAMSLDELLALHSGVPEAKRGSAALALHAFQSALEGATS
jgi:NifU-like protein involved in Fe-S cluster formation